MQINNRWILLFALGIVAFLINIDYLAVNLALIPMAADLQSSLDTIRWVLSGYVLSWAVLVIPAGYYSDKYGSKRMCVVGLALFMLASLFAGLANSAGLLIAARILQGMAGAICIPTLYALIYVNFAEKERGKAIGLLSLGVGLGMALGPFIGGVLLSYLDWRSIFLINIPIGLVPFIIVYLSKTASAPQKLSNPIIPLKLFKNSAFLGCSLGMLLEQYSFSAIMVISALYLQKVLLFSSFKSSIIYLSLSVIFGVIAVVGGSWVDRIGLRLPAMLGLFILGVGSFAFSFLSADSEIWNICLVFAVIGIGMGLAFSALNTGLVKTVSVEFIGIASSVFIMFCLLGNALGVTFTTLVYEQASLSHLSQTITPTHDLRQIQIQQLTDHVANIGATHTNLDSFDAASQQAIIDNTIDAFSYGVSSVMWLTLLICLLALVCCMSLLKSNSIRSPMSLVPQDNLER